MIEEIKVREKEKPNYFLSLTLHKDYFGISKNEIKIYLGQLDAKPKVVDIVGANKVFISISSERELERVIKAVKKGKEMVEWA